MLPGGGFVVLDTEVTPELAAEGLARDLVRAVQQARRDAGLDVSDRIALTIGGSAGVQAAARTHESLIAGETLATSYAVRDADGEGTPVTVGDNEKATVLRHPRLTPSRHKLRLPWWAESAQAPPRRVARVGARSDRRPTLRRLGASGGRAPAASDAARASVMPSPAVCSSSRTTGNAGTSARNAPELAPTRAVSGRSRARPSGRPWGRLAPTRAVSGRACAATRAVCGPEPLRATSRLLRAGAGGWTGRMTRLDLTADAVTLTEQLVDIESVSHHEQEIADAVEEALRTLGAPRGHPPRPHRGRAHRPRARRAGRDRRPPRHGPGQRQLAVAPRGAPGRRPACTASAPAT